MYILSCRKDKKEMITKKSNFQVIRTDNGTNFVGTNAKLNKEFSEMNHKKINEFMLEHGGQCIQWKRNHLNACNMGRVWICRV